MLPVPMCPEDPDLVVRRWAHHPRSVPAARAELRAHLGRWGTAAEVADTAALVLTELLTNAVQHAGEPRGRQIETRFRRGAAGVRIEVHDANDGKPEPREASAEDESGRGLAMVDALTAGRWGVSGREGVGKLVWAQCGPPDRAAPPPGGEG